jgi:hypothetical protein
LAAIELDKVWNETVTTMSTSYGKTLELLDAGKKEEARDEYRGNFLQAVKKLHGEAATTYPQRFAAAKDWCTWVKDLYATSVKVDQLLAAQKAEEARPLLVSLRQAFYDLHEQTNTRSVNDLIHALRVEAAKEEPSAEKMRALRGELERAPASKASKAHAAEYAKARDAWAAKVEPILADGKVEAGEREALRAATEAFYRAYGMAFE